ncbi:Type 1 glutamine amidotransferase-like domain-containing protein [Planctomycetota bacterium]|nr:Type 1 glutamine amidotransferase-like domain-containing protein [Planctomycetota bacterium]
MTFVTVLGPQRRKPFIKQILDDQGIRGGLAVITGGWEEREGELDDLDEHVGRPTLNLRLHGRLQGVIRGDSGFSLALVDRNDRLRIAQTLYRRRLRSALESVRSLYELTLPRMELLLAERADALQAVSDLDAHYLSQIRGIHEAFHDVWDPTLEETTGEVRQKIAEELSSCEAVLIAGGNVGVLLDQLYLLKLRPMLENKPIVAWSAGAMVLTERIVLFHDSPPQGRGAPEIYDDGMGLAPALVALPQASKRLMLDDEQRVGIFAGRFAPSACITLDEGCGARWDGTAWHAVGEARRLTPEGHLAEVGAA